MRAGDIWKSWLQSVHVNQYFVPECCATSNTSVAPLRILFQQTTFELDANDLRKQNLQS